MSDSPVNSAFLDLELHAEVWLASEKILLSRLLELHRGEVLELTKDPEGPVDLLVNGTIVASGELVIVDGKFGFECTKTAQQQIAELENTLPPEATS